MSHPDQVLFHLNLASDNPLSVGELTARMPDKRNERHIFEVTDFGAVATQNGTPADWSPWLLAISRMVEAARAKLTERPSRFYVAGRAGLPAFFFLGHLLQKWASAELIYFGSDGSVESYALDVPDADGAYFASPTLPSPASEASGRLALVLTAGVKAPRDALRSLIQDRGESLAGVIECDSAEPLSPGRFTSARRDISMVLGAAQRAFPSARSLAVVVGGPTTLAYLAGALINPNVTNDMLVAEWVGDRYEVAYSLPTDIRTAPLVLRDEDEPERLRALGCLRGGVLELQAHLTAEHVPAFVDQSARDRLVNDVKSLDVETGLLGDEFFISVAERKLAFGRSLVEAIRNLTDESLRMIGGLFCLHEAYHAQQNIHSTTYQGIGRASFALEEVDYWADCIALATMANMALATQPERDDGTRMAVRQLIRALRESLVAFDRAAHGARIERLSDRRLRRYLIWALQAARAETISARTHIHALFSQRIVAELAPLRASLDERGDRIVRGVASETEVFVVNGHRLARRGATASINIAAIVDAVRTYDHGALTTFMTALRDLCPETLALPD